MRKYVLRFIALAFISLGVLLLISACAGEAGEQGEQGPPGPPGEQGPAGPPGPAGEAFTLPGEGINSEITDVAIGEDQVPVVTFTLSDDNGSPLTIDDVESVRFLLSRIEVDDETGLTQYVNYFLRDSEGAEFNYGGETLQPAVDAQTQPTFEGGEGEFSELSAGEYSYTFAEPLGDDYAPDTTHVAGIVVERPSDQVDNAVYTFVPSGDEVTTTRLISTTETCNNCHNELAFHGGSRKEYDVCVLCHTPQNIDPETGNSADFKVMIHKIHSGELLPSVEEGEPYYIVGFRQSIHDYSHVVWPQDTRNCETCHTGPDGDNYKTAPNNAACTACHDNVDATTALNHEGSPKTDAECIDCHTAEMIEFDDESIPGSHLIPINSAQLAGVNLEFVSVEGAAPGESPTVSFKVTNNNGEPIAPGDMDYLAVTLAGPTSDYLNRVTETIYRSGEDAPEPNVEDLGDGVYSYTFEYAFPEDATGSYGVGLEGYVMETLDEVEDPVRVAGFNPVTYVALDGSEPVARRQVVDRENCNACHQDIKLHGTIRQNTEYCVMCHNPTASDIERRPEEELPPTSINFRILIHRIHSGGEAENPLVVYGFGGNAHDYSEVEFPGNLAECETCHVEGSYALPLPSGVQSTTISIEDEVVSELLPVQSVCTSCHDSDAARGHAEIQTASDDNETCVVCHATGREISVLDVHD